MKIRTGFVSNSSSSSFIVAFKHFPKLALPESTPGWVATLVNKSLETITEPDSRFCEDDSKLVATIEELQEYYLNEYCYPKQSFDEWQKSDIYKSRYQKDYEKYLKAIEEGYTICFREVDYNNRWLSDFFESLPDKDDGSGIYLIDSYD